MSSPKASLHMLYLYSDKQPRYETASVAAPEKESVANGSVVSVAFLVKPLSLQKNGFRCTLFLPDLPPIMSEVFPRKRDAEQDAARKALEQMGKSFILEDSGSKAMTTEEKVEALIDRLGTLFSEKVALSSQPLQEHFRAALRRKDEKFGAVSAAALAVLDNRISSLCKSIHGSPDGDPLFAVAMVLEAAKRCPTLTCEEGCLIRSKQLFSPKFQSELFSSDIREEGTSSKFWAVYIPYAEDARVTELKFTLEPNLYYLDAILKELPSEEQAGIIMSRTIARAPHDTRLYSMIPKTFQDTNYTANGTVDFGLKLAGKDDARWNRRATSLVGYAVHGDAILASVGSSWKSEGKLSFVDVSLSCYYRLVLGRTPDGNYMLSRNAILLAKLPCSFTSRAQWRGTLPRSLLIEFCHQHRLADPEFRVFPKESTSISAQADKENGSSVKNSYKCKAKVVYEGEVIEHVSEHLYRNSNDALQSSALQILHSLSKRVHSVSEKDGEGQLVEILGSDEKTSTLSSSQGDASKTIVAGSMVAISCSVWLVGCGIDIKVESHEDFEFELGIGAIVTELENVIMGMRVGGCEEIILPMPNQERVLAALEDPMGSSEDPMASSKVFNIELGFLRYKLKVLRSLEPPEERMESALFSPPLSKQRNEFAVNKVSRAQAKTLVDFGCGSGSLLDAVVDHSTDLEYIAGVDISLKSLLRAAKSLNAKLGLHDNGSSSSKLKRVVLYEGSLAEPDPRLCGFDIATCMEVIEHMDPEPLCKAGEIILGVYSPQILILSTPNIEYNALLQKLTVEAKGEGRVRPVSDEKTPLEESSHDKSEPQNDEAIVKFRNEDHRFEWTRAEFAEWADELASRYGYTVEYSGVGGSVEDPGFASQVAIFTRNVVDIPAFQESGTMPCYREVWKYDKGGLH